MHKSHQCDLYTVTTSRSNTPQTDNLCSHGHNELKTENSNATLGVQLGTKSHHAVSFITRHVPRSSTSPSDKMHYGSHVDQHHNIALVKPHPSAKAAQPHGTPITQVKNAHTEDDFSVEATTDKGHQNQTVAER